jgi:hypothetical protein
LANGNLLVPRRAQAKDVIGDALIEIGPDDPEFDQWIAYLDRVEKESTESGDAGQAIPPNTEGQ